MSRGRPRHQSSRRRMYSGRQRDVRERRAHEDWDLSRAFDHDVALEADEPREHETTTGWSVGLQARASAA